MKAKISIIVPVYNVEKYIDRCIQSILAQTYTNFELILVDDGSPDKCGKICDEYAKKDMRIKVIHKKNGGLGDARNCGLSIATGEYIGFIDSDDYIESDMYEKLINACIEKKSDIAVCGRYDVVDGKLKKRFSFEGTKVLSNSEAIKAILTTNNIDSSACDKLFRKKLFENIRFPKGKLNEDIYVMTKIISNSNRVVHIGESKYYYDHRPNSITTKCFSNRNMDSVEAAKEVLEYIKQNYPEFKKEADFFHYEIVSYTLSTINSRELKVKYRDCFNELRKIIFKNTINIITNKYINSIGIKTNMKTWLRVFNIFDISKNIKSMFCS